MKHLTTADQRRALVEAFTDAVVRIVERAVLAEVQNFLGAQPATKTAAKRTAPPKARRPAAPRAPSAPPPPPPPARSTQPPPARPTQPPAPKRDRPAAGDASARVLEFVQRHRGVSAEEARAGLGIDRGAWSTAIAKLVLDGAVKREGDRRSARYYAPFPAAAEPFVPVPPIRRKARG